MIYKIFSRRTQNDYKQEINFSYSYSVFRDIRWCITIPNISNLKEDSKVPGFSKEKDSDKTFTNFAIDPSIEKCVEDDQSAVIDTGEATDELSVSDAIGDAQSTIDGLSDDKKDTDDVQQLRKALLTSSNAKEIKRLSDKLK